MNCESMTPHAALAQSFSLPNGTLVRNRIFKSAMSEALATSDGAPTPALTHLYGAWADGGVGLCVTGNVMIDARALGEPGNVVIEDERNHPGKQAPTGLNRENVAPSVVPFRAEMKAFFPAPRELRDDEIHEIIARFGRAAGIVRRAGFSGVQIHGAHGYLVSQFLSPHHNRREDAWGGTPEKRRRFVLAVLAAIRSDWHQVELGRFSARRLYRRGVARHHSRPG